MNAHQTPIHQLSAVEKRALLARLMQERRATHAQEGALGQDAPSRSPHPFAEFVNPYLAERQQQLKLDKRFVRGEGCALYDERGERYLDFTAMFGALPFGFNYPPIWQAVREVEASLEPSFTQPSLLDAAGELAQRLIALAPEGLRYVTFANSGAETVEAAIKLARAATGRRNILSTVLGFHGKTLGALSATGRAEYQTPFGLPLSGFETIPYGSVQALRHVLSQRGHEFAAFIVEPIQGEGGVITPPADYLRKARDLCSQHGVLLVVDEVQTGLGRTGRLFACDQAGVCPDVLLLAKALGGGLMPIGAVLCTEASYTEDFALKHSSTFAGNTLACRVALKTLDLLTQGNLLQQVTANGSHLKTELQALQRQHPELLTDIRGAGYLLGLEWTAQQEAFGRRCILSFMAETEDLAIGICSYLLNQHHIRVMTTLNGSRVIRVEPPLIATRAECDQLIAALDDVLQHLSACHSGKVFAHLASDHKVVPSLPPLPAQRAAHVKPTGDPREGRWAFITHPIHLASFSTFDPSLACFDPSEIERLTYFLRQNAEPNVLGSTRIESDDHKVAYGEFINVPYTSTDFTQLPFHKTVATIRKAVKLARERGAGIVGLGAFTSIVTRNGLALRGLGTPITTGNSYTAVATVAGVEAACSEAERQLSDATVAVVGATGSIGRAVALLLATQVDRLILIGNPDNPEQSLKHLQSIREELETLPSHTAHVVVTTDLDHHLPDADVVVAVTSSPRKIIRAEHLKHGAIVYDTAQPTNVDPGVQHHRPDVKVIDGGIIRVPGAQDLGCSFGLPKGKVYACMAETIMLGLEKRYQHGSIGNHLDQVFMIYMRELACRHGFSLDAMQAVNSR
jgi:acetylornithine/succinyldiaminopimelate/putrescine aminotransferase/predicted amino acid dehydrogenase